MALRNGGFRNSFWYRSIVLILVLVSLVLVIFYAMDTEYRSSMVGDLDFLEEFDKTTLQNGKRWILKPPPKRSGDQKSIIANDIDTASSSKVEIPTLLDHQSTIESIQSDQESDQDEDEDEPPADKSQNEPPDSEDAEVTGQTSGNKDQMEPSGSKNPDAVDKPSGNNDQMEPPDTNNSEAVDVPVADNGQEKSQTSYSTASVDLVAESIDLVINNDSEPEEKPMQDAIPSILHQSVPSEMLPESYVALIETCLTSNPDWQYYLWRDQDRHEFLRVHYPQHADWFLRRSRQEQDDLFRYFVLPKYGGMYLDLDMYCLRPLSPLLMNASLFVAQERPELARIVRNVAYSADATALAGAPGHQLFAIILESLAELPADPVDVSDLLTGAFDALPGNCTLRDYRYFGGGSLDSAMPWQELCKEVLEALLQGAYGPEDTLYYKQLGCVQLRDQNWLGPVDSSSDNVTVAQHTHRTWDSSVADNQRLVNITELFGSEKILHYN